MGPRPHRHTPRPRPSLPTSLHERNIAPAGHPTAWLTSSVKETSPPARQKLAKIATFEHAGAKNISRHPTAPHAGAVFLSLLPLPYPTSATKFAQHAQNRPKSAVFRQQGEFCLGLTQNPDLLGEFYLAHEHPRFHPRQALRPQPKPRAARAETTTPVPHWPHD